MENGHLDQLRLQQTLHVDVFVMLTHSIYLCLYQEQPNMQNRVVLPVNTSFSVRAVPAIIWAQNTTRASDPTFTDEVENEYN